jgi:arylformamidase
MRRLIDVSLGIADGGLVYPGNPPIRVAPHQRIAEGDGANVSRIELGSHTATHVDAPWHFLDDGATVDQLALERLVGPARVLGAPDDLVEIDAAWLRTQPLDGAERVLFRTRNSSFNAEREFVRDYTHLTGDGAEYLVERGVVLVGVDYLSVERFRSGHHRAHLALLRAGVVIVEGLALGHVAPGDYELFCLPLKLVGLDGAPARAVLVEGEQ